VTTPERLHDAAVERERGKRLRRSKKEKRRPTEMKERERFRQRWRFDQAVVWQRREPRSLIQSTWPALEAEMRKWVTPGFSMP
jgi:hypothetical protein